MTNLKNVKSLKDASEVGIVGGAVAAGASTHCPLGGHRPASAARLPKARPPGGPRADSGRVLQPTRETRAVPAALLLLTSFFFLLPLGGKSHEAGPALRPGGWAGLSAPPWPQVQLIPPPDA